MMHAIWVILNVLKQNRIKKIIVSQNLEGARACFAPPGSATGIDVNFLTICTQPWHLTAVSKTSICHNFLALHLILLTFHCSVCMILVYSFILTQTTSLSSYMIIQSYSFALPLGPRKPCSSSSSLFAHLSSSSFFSVDVPGDSCE